MHLERREVARLDRDGGRGEALLDVTEIDHLNGAELVRRIAQRVRQGGLRDERLPVVPVRDHAGIGVGCLDGRPLGPRDHADEVALPNQLDEAGYRRGPGYRGGLDRKQRGVASRRADHAPVQHARHGDVLDVTEVSGHLVGQVGALHRLADYLVILG